MQSPGSGQQWPKGTGGPDSEPGHIKQENSHHTLNGWGKGVEGQCTERDLGKAPQTPWDVTPAITCHRARSCLHCKVGIPQ